MDLKNATDEQLEEIVRKAENSHNSGSQFEMAQIELDIRRKRKLFELQEKIFNTLQSRLDMIIHILTYINKQPLVAVLLAGLWAIIIGILINVISACFVKYI
jgi:enoyl-[acyl-carrier-protein] reductase (NADH)